MNLEPRDWEFEKYLRQSGVFYSQPHTVHEKYHAVWKAAQHRMHWTALWVGLGSFILGFATCAIILYWL